MQLHELRAKHKNKKRKRIGRGGKKGSYSGKGIKGQRSRAGARFEPVIRALVKRYPKLRGYRFGRQSEKPAVVNVGELEKSFNSGNIVSPEILLEKRIVSRIKGRAPKVKILGKGKLTKELVIENCQLSKAAREIIEKAGGKTSPKP
ncbi:MAG: 50S ribosomal protein L15 [Candidatus Nealsonbacteria bacterium]|nr:50S ribosomal protein L15 [Candidatus Nealsonbacteria bacterium]